MADRPPGDSAGNGLPALGIAVVAIGCCAGLPLLLVLAASLGIGTVLGILGGIVAAALLVGAVVIWAVRRRTACESPPHPESDNGAGNDRGRAREVTR
jgi:hypothetical protein